MHCTTVARFLIHLKQVKQVFKHLPHYDDEPVKQVERILDVAIQTQAHQLQKHFKSKYGREDVV